MPQYPLQQPLDSLSAVMRRYAVPPEETDQALQGLKAAQGSDPNLAWHAMKENEKSDLEAGLTNPFYAGTPRAAAMKTQLGQVEGDLSDPNDPINRSRALTQRTENAQHAATLAGFQSPQDAAAYERKQAETKLTQPLDIEKLKGMFGIDTEKLKGATAQEVERMKAEAYGNKSMYDLMKAREADQAKRDVADTAGKSRVNSALIRGGSPELGRINEGIATGKLDPNNANVQNAQGAFERMLAQGSGTPSEMDVTQHVKSLIAEHPGWNLQQHLQAIDPDGQQFDSPADKQLFIKTMQANGIR